MVMWRIIVGVLLASLLSVGSWGMTRVVSMGERHPTRHEFYQHVEEANEKFKEIQEELREQQRRVEDKIDKIQEFLMDKE